MLEPAEDRLGRQELDPRGGQLDGQRHAVEPGADGRHGGRVLVGDGEARLDRHRALDEQAHGGVLLDRRRVDGARLAGHGQSLEPAQVARVRWRRQAGHRVLLLARHVQGGSAGDDDLDPGARPQQVGDDRRRRDHLLEVVEHEQHGLCRAASRRAVGDRPGATFGYTDGAGDPGGDQHRVADGLERHEEDAVRKVVRDARGELERQSRLARPARARQGQQPSRPKEGRRLGQLGVATDEGRQLGRQVVGMGVGRPRRGELGGQPVDDHLDQVDRRQEVLEAEGTQIPQRDVGRQVRREQPACRIGHEDLAAVGHRRDARRLVDVDADHAATAGRRSDALGFAGVEPHPDPDVDAIGPGLAVERALTGDGGGQGGGRPPERDEERIALGALLDPAVRLPRRAQEHPVALEDLAVALGPERLLELRRAFDIAEQEGDGAARRGLGLGHPCVVVRQWWVASVSSRSRDASPRRIARATRGSSSRTASKSHDASARHVVGPTAMTWALRGLPSRTDSSPKKSPGPRVAIVSPPRTTRAPPLTTMKKPVPISPWRAIT